MKILAIVLLLLPTAMWAQQAPVDLTGSWQAETPEGPQVIVVRDDFTASFGEETVELRIVADTIFVLFGDEWLGYNFEIEGNTLTLSGGDLIDPVILVRVGPPALRRRAKGSF
jgi:hypothetical protein